MRSQSRWLLRGVLLGLLTLAVAIGQAAPTATGAPLGQAGGYLVYLPAVQVGGGLITGRIVSARGSVAADSVALYCGDTGIGSVRLSETFLAHDGAFSFGLNTAVTGTQFCFVYYARSGSDLTKLAWLDSGDVTEIGRDQVRDLGALDATGIDLGSPSSGATVSMPTDFSWARRNTSSDNYVLWLADPAVNLDTLTTSDLGYVDHVRIGSLAADAGYQPNVEYLWGLEVYMPNGSFGGTTGRAIRFSNIVTFDVSQVLGTLSEIGPLTRRPVHQAGNN